MTIRSRWRALRRIEWLAMKSPLAHHPLRHSIALQLKSHPLLAMLPAPAHDELAALLCVQEAHRGERLLEQGSRELRQFFVLEGLLKRVVTSAGGREMTLRFAAELDMETCYEAWREGSGAGFALVCAQRSRVAWLPMAEWHAFLQRHPQALQAFHERLVQLGAALVEHAVGLLLLDATGRVHQFSHKHPELVGRLPQKDLASHLNLSAETLCRLSRRAVYCAP
jgi:CRP-like cAMP-binding protein